MTADQIETMLQQNALLIEQNRQLLAMMASGQTAVPLYGKPTRKRTSSKERKAAEITAWYGHINKMLPPILALKLKDKIQKKDLWKV